MKRFRVLILLVAIAGLLTGCTTSIASFTLVSTKPLEPGARYVNLGHFEGTSTCRYVLNVPLDPYTTFEAAVDSCLRAGKGVIVTDAEFRFGLWDYLLWQREEITVSGTVWKKDLQ